MKRQSLDRTQEAEVLDGVHVAPLLVGDDTNIQQFRIEPGVETALHSHPQEQIMVVTRGELTVLCDDEEVTVGPRESVLFESNETHATENRSAKVAEGFDVFSPPRPDVEQWLGSAD